MTDTALIRAALPGNTCKRLARAMGISLKTAQHWIYYGPARSRRQELSRVLLAELDRQDADRAELRRQLTDMAA